MAKKSVKKPAKKAKKAKKAVKVGRSAEKRTAQKMADAKVRIAREKVEARTAKKAPNPQQKPKTIQGVINDVKKEDVARAVGKSPALAAPYGMTPAVHDFATAFKSMMAGPPKRSAASLLGDEAPPQINGVTLRELVTTFIADNKRFGEITSYAKAAGFDAQAFAIVAVLHLPYMRETKAAVELYTKMLAEP